MAKLLRVLCATVCGLLVAVAIQSKQLAAPPMGFNTWNFYACDIDENIIKETADAMASKVANLGYKYLNIDDCWQAPYRDKDGKLVADPTRFPSGIKSLADYVHNLGHSLTHSLTYSLTHSLTQGLKIGIYSSAGFYTCQKYPASLGYEAVDAATFYEWNVDYFKYDNCYTDAGWPEKRYSIMAESLRVTAPSNLNHGLFSL
jgi:alpha-galactosidase